MMGPRRGRPRSFDRGEALDRAVQVFWAKGYEATQVADLTGVMGINPPSFYAAFLSKGAIYREAIGRYLATEGGGSMRALDEEADLRSAIRTMLRASVEVALSSLSAGGCMVSLGLVNGGPNNALLRGELRDLRRGTAMQIAERIRRGIVDRDLPDDTDVDRLAFYFATTMHGISLQAQDGASREQLLAFVETAMSAFDQAAA